MNHLIRLMLTSGSILFAGSQTIFFNKDSTSQFPYGSCGLVNKNQMSATVSPYKFLGWSKVSVAQGKSAVEKNYYVLNMALWDPVCDETGQETCDLHSTVLCHTLCEYAAHNGVDAIHIPINNTCLATPTHNMAPCNALIVKSYPAGGLFNSQNPPVWKPVTFDLNSCDGIVTQMRFNLKGFTPFSQALSQATNETEFQFAIPEDLFNSTLCATWNEVCRSNSQFSEMSECAIAPYINTNYIIDGKKIGGHEFCPVLEANADLVD